MSGALIAAVAVLLGVAIGGFITSFNQAKERRQRRIREQADEFYGPMVGIRKTILAKSEVRVRIQGLARAALDELTKGMSSETREEFNRKRGPEFAKITDYDNRQLMEELIPSYRKMLKHFGAHMSLAEPSTRAHLPELVEFIELWNRHLDDSLPSEVSMKLQHDEAKLYPFYADLESHLDRLSREATKEPELSRFLREAWDRLRKRASDKK